MRCYLCVLILTTVLMPVFASNALAENTPGKPVVELAREFTKKYQDRQPVLWGDNLPGIVKSLPKTDTPATGKRVALTLDACDGTTDTRIIALLKKYALPATVFMSGRWLRNNLPIAQELAKEPFITLACHGEHHKPASVTGKSAYGIRGTTSVAALVAEVETNARAVAAITGKRPDWYRSGTACYDEVALAVIADCGLKVAGFAVSADAGAKLPGNAVAANLIHAPDSAVILCHINHPESGTYDGLATAIPAMLAAGVRFVPLDDNRRIKKPE